MRSEPSRILAGRLNKKIIDSIMYTNPLAKIINMGDFNDNPSNKSIQILEKESQLFNPFSTVWTNKKGKRRRYFPILEGSTGIAFILI